MDGCHGFQGVVSGRTSAGRRLEGVGGRRIGWLRLRAAGPIKPGPIKPRRINVGRPNGRAELETALEEREPVLEVLQSLGKVVAAHDQPPVDRDGVRVS
jgi:hypothetical protein